MDGPRASRLPPDLPITVIIRNIAGSALPMGSAVKLSTGDADTRSAMPADVDHLSPGQVANVLGAASSGAGWAFEALYRHFAPKVIGYLRLQGVWDPEDLSSEVFLAVFKGLDTFVGGESEFRSWLFSIAYRKSIDDRRRCARRVARADAGSVTARPVPAGTDPEVEVLAGMAADRVAGMCSKLLPDQRDVLLLRLVGDLTLEETAAATRKSKGAIRALQYRGLQKLKVLLLAEISAEGARR